MFAPLNTKRRLFQKLCMAIAAEVTIAPAFSKADKDGIEVIRTVRSTITISNPSSQQLRDQAIWLYLPINHTSVQKVESITVSVPHEVVLDSLGQTILHLSWDNVSPFSTKLVSISTDLSLRTDPLATHLTHREEWLRPERYIETSDVRVRALAVSLRRDSDAQTARAIYDWTRNNLRYAGYIADDRGAVDALASNSGDCTEYAYLVTALARANGIPARMVGGFVMMENGVPRPEDYHNWAEAYFNGAWQMLDAQKENWLSPASQYIGFHFYRDEVINPIGLAHRFKATAGVRISF
jgi:transglutaminase-like putative cysteine protease